jgi:Microcystin-dependent protein
MTYAQIHDLITDNLESNTKIPASKHREVEYALLDYIQANLAQSGDIKLIKCDVDYLNANFEPTGLGKNLRLGWAICNGNIHSGQQVENLAGRTVIGWGGSFSTFGAEGGSPDTVLVSHFHNSVASVTPGGEYSATNKYTAAFRNSGGDSAYGLQGTATATNTGSTSEVGVSGAGKNYQPYKVELYIQKL